MKQYDELYRDLADATDNLSFWTKYWKINYGKHAKQRVAYWQEKVDGLLKKLNRTKHTEKVTLEDLQ